jgi:hypothetical protein
MAGIFLCYRREDTRWCAGRIHDRLCDVFDPGAVFWDVESIGGGVKFKEEIGRRISGSDVVLVLIGSRWLEASPVTGQPRLEDAEDFVEKELSLALGTEKHVVPVLVDDAELPEAESLPPRLRGLTERQAVRVRFSDFQSDMDDLLLSVRQKISLSRASRVRLGLRRMRIPALVSCLVLGAAGGFGLSALTSGEPPREDQDTMAREGVYQDLQRKLLNRLEGVVETSDGRPIADASVSATVRGRSVQTTTVSDGVYTLDITELESRPDDPVLVRATAPGHGEKSFSFFYRDGMRRHRFVLAQ